MTRKTRTTREFAPIRKLRRAFTLPNITPRKGETWIA